MSWDIAVFACESVPPPMKQMPKDWRGAVLGSQKEVREKISACLPQVNWRDPTWGMLDGDGFSFEFNVGRDEPNDGFMIHVRGGGDAVAALDRLAIHSGWFFVDCSQGEWIHHCADRQAGWTGFQNYRDRVIRDDQR